MSEQEASFDAFPVVSPGENAGKDEFEAFPVVGTSVGEKMGALGASANRAFIENAPIIGGMAAGASIGALGGPAAPLTVPLGAAVGAASGYFFGREAAQGASQAAPGMVAPPVEEMSPELRPYGYAGAVIGGSVPIAAVPLAAAQAGVRLPSTMVGRFLNKIVDFAAESPTTFAAGEGAMMAGSATGAALAEGYSPGSTGMRVAAEIGGGFFNPQRVFIAVGNYGAQGVRRAVQALSPAGRETAAAKILQDIVSEAGEDADVLVRLLADPNVAGSNLTAAQKTGSPALIALESRLMKDSAKFGAEAEKRAKDGLAAVTNAIDALRATGDPQALAQVADLRLRYFRTLIAGRLQGAEQEALDAARRISGDSPADMANLSRQASEAVGNAMADARAVESELWGQISRDIPASTRRITAGYDEIRAGLLPEERLPEIVEGFVSRMAEAGGRTTTGELIRFRSRALALAREAAGQGKANDARIYGQLAESALDDLDATFGGADAGVLRTLGTDTEAYTAARTFSRELHETFTRTFAGASQRTTGTGADRIPPEILLRRAFATGREAGELRLQELEEATGFMARVQPNSPEAAANVAQMLNAQSRVLRLAAAESIDPNTGRISATRLGRFLRNNEAVLERFPEVRDDLRSALTSETRLVEMQQSGDLAGRLVERRTAFAQVAKVENPMMAVKAAASGGAPENDLAALAKLAKRGGDRAVGGLKTSVMDYALEQSTSTSGDVSLTKLRAALFEPIRVGSDSVADLMRREGVFTPADIQRLTVLFDRAANIEKALSGNKGLEKLIGEPDALTDTILRIAGARMGAAMAEGGSGATLIAASRGSAMARNIFEKMPAARVTDVLREAAVNPELMALLLKKPKNQAEGIKVARQIHAYLWQAGLIDDGGQE